MASIGIKPGDTLVFSRDEAVTAIVADDGKSLLLDGEILSPSAAALKSLVKKSYEAQAASGSVYWMFEGETLAERRHRLEKDEYEMSDE